MDCELLVAGIKLDGYATAVLHTVFVENFSHNMLVRFCRPGVHLVLDQEIGLAAVELIRSDVRFRLRYRGLDDPRGRGCDNKWSVGAGLSTRNGTAADPSY